MNKDKLSSNEMSGVQAGYRYPACAACFRKLGLDPTKLYETTGLQELLRQCLKCNGIFH